jgi:hypothetical protein
MFWGALPMFFGALPMFFGALSMFWGASVSVLGQFLCFGLRLLLKRDQCVCKAPDASARKNKQQNNEKMSLRET